MNNQPVMFTYEEIYQAFQDVGIGYLECEESFGIVCDSNGEEFFLDLYEVSLFSKKVPYVSNVCSQKKWSANLCLMDLKSIKDDSGVSYELARRAEKLIMARRQAREMEKRTSVNVNESGARRL